MSMPFNALGSARLSGVVKGSDLLDHWFILLLGHVSQVARQGEEHSLQLGKAVHHLSRANPGMQDQAIWEGCMLIQDLLQLAKGAHAVHLQPLSTLSKL